MRVHSRCANAVSKLPSPRRPLATLSPTEYTDEKGRIRKRYRYQDMMTPYEKLRSLPDAENDLKPGITFKQLDAIATQCSDNDAAKLLNEARTKLFQLINKSQQRAA